MTTTIDHDRPHDGKLAIVTGGASGMGHAICRLFGELGASVVSFDVANPADPLDGVDYRHVDVRKRQQVVDAIDGITANRDIDIVVTAAGVFPNAATIDEIDEDELARVMDINFSGTLWVVQAALPSLRRSNGRVVCIGSVAGRYGVVRQGPHYAASKAAVHILVRSLASNEARQGVRVNGIAPGAIDTPMIDGKGYSPDMSPMGRFGSADEIARSANFLCSDDSSYLTGVVLDVNGGAMTI